MIHQNRKKLDQPGPILSNGNDSSILEVLAMIIFIYIYIYIYIIYINMHPCYRTALFFPRRLGGTLGWELAQPFLICFPSISR